MLYGTAANISRVLTTTWPARRQLAHYGDGRGGFETRLIFNGIGTHEGKLGDLDGDGDLDLIQKDFDHERRIDLWYNEG